MNRSVCVVIRSGSLIVCATLCICIWEHCIILQYLSAVIFLLRNNYTDWVVVNNIRLQLLETC